MSFPTLFRWSCLHFTYWKPLPALKAFKLLRYFEEDMITWQITFWAHELQPWNHTCGWNCWDWPAITLSIFFSTVLAELILIQDIFKVAVSAHQLRVALDRLAPSLNIWNNHNAIVASLTLYLFLLAGGTRFPDPVTLITINWLPLLIFLLLKGY